LSAVNSLRLGDTVSSLTAVIDYSFGEYLVIPVVAPTFAATNARTDAPDLGNLRVASLNVLNYFETIDDGSNICGPLLTLAVVVQMMLKNLGVKKLKLYRQLLLWMQTQ
jgi:hypothetical protein